MTPCHGRGDKPDTRLLVHSNRFCFGARVFLFCSFCAFYAPRKDAPTTCRVAAARVLNCTHILCPPAVPKTAAAIRGALRVFQPIRCTTVKLRYNEHGYNEIRDITN